MATRTKKAETRQPTPAEMKEALEADRQTRIQNAGQALEALCNKYKVALTAQCVITGSNVETKVAIVPTE